MGLRCGGVSEAALTHIPPANPKALLFPGISVPEANPLFVTFASIDCFQSDGMAESFLNVVSV